MNKFKLFQMSLVSLEQANQAIGYMNQFLERLRTESGFNLLTCYTFQDIANLHVSMARLNTFIGQQLPVEEKIDNSKIHVI